MTQTRAAVELAIAGALWGFGFIAAMWSLNAGGPLAITGWRFVVAASIGLSFSALISWFRKTTRPKINWKLNLKTAGLPGLLIAGTLIFQTWGLQYTTATKSGFITCLYVLIVPLIEPLIGGPRPSRTVWLSALGALGGVALMCGLFTAQDLDQRSRLNLGDYLTLLAAFCASFHILAIDRVSGKLGRGFDSHKFNTAQSLVAGLPTLAIALAIEPGALTFPVRLVTEPSVATIGFLSLAIGSTLIAFALQVRAQKYIPPTTASLLFLLESPFAAIFATLLLSEVMGPMQLIGGAIILTSVGFSTFTSARE
jgi:drug/metabolite transporter (DMT)-like permease